MLPFSPSLDFCHILETQGTLGCNGQIMKEAVLSLSLTELRL